MNKALFKSMALILLIGLISSMVPFFTIGLVLGLPSVLLNTIVLALVFKEKLSKE